MLELLRRFGYRPIACVWELTLSCNLRCKHCGSIAGDSRPDELSLAECLDVADQLAALGCQRVTLSGGEPTVHPHWHEIGRRLTDRGIKVNIISNGWYWKQGHVERARAAGLLSVAFSLDGLERDHDYMRRQGSYERVLASIDCCVRAGMPTAVNTTITQHNCRSLPELRQLLIDHGVFAWQLQIATPTGNLAQHRDLVMRPEDMLWLVPQVAEMCEQPNSPIRVSAGDDIGYYGRCEQALRDAGHTGPIPFWVGCRAGCQVIGIESNGNVKGCLSLPSAMQQVDRFVEGNLRSEPLAAIWQRPGAFAYNREFTPAQLGGFCAVCRHRELCRGGCSWTAYSHSHEHADNPYCFYRQAVEHGRFDLLDEEPTPTEQRYFAEPCPDR